MIEEIRKEEKEEILQIPYVAFEAELARCERMIKRWWIVCIILIIALLGTNAAWVIYENQYSVTTIMQDTDAVENSTIIGIGNNPNEERKSQAGH